MDYLLDTHAFLWFITDDKQLSRKATHSIENPDSRKYVSMASLREIAIKLNIRKLELDIPFSEGYISPIELNEALHHTPKSKKI